MAEVTRLAALGANSTESISEVVISKADLQTQGLTPSASNKAEGIIAALFKRWIPLFTPDGYGANLDQSITITEQTSTFQTRSDGSKVIVDAWLFEVVSPDTRTGINPDVL